MSNIEREIIDVRCQYCGRQCFAPLTTEAPQPIRQAYLKRKVNLLATCPAGQALEKRLLGYCWGDIQNSVQDYAVSPAEIGRKGESIVC